MSDELVIDRQDTTWSFTLNRPAKRNALSSELVEALLDSVERAHEARARLLVFRGAGANLSAGFDFTDVESESEGDLLRRFVRIETLLATVAASPAMTLALAHGRNFGAGVDLFGACRARIAAPESTFRMPGLLFGLVLGTRRFGEIVGAAKAQTILQSAATFDATEAREMGFVHRVAAPEDWSDAVAQSATAASACDDASRAALFKATSHEQADADLAALVRSAARPGLKARIATYLQASASKTPPRP